MGDRRANEGDELALLVADLYDAAGVLRRYGERIAAAAGQTQARWQVLSVVSGGDWTVPMAADRLGTSRQAVQRIANELVDDGLAAFVGNPRHRRSPFLRLTKAGEGTLATISDLARSSHAKVLHQLSDVDVTRLRSALNRLAASVRSELDR